jgi:hypothetical protein
MHRKKKPESAFPGGLVLAIKRVSAMRGRREPAPMTEPGRTSGAGLRTMVY